MKILRRMSFFVVLKKCYGRTKQKGVQRYEQAYHSVKGRSCNCLHDLSEWRVKDAESKITRYKE